MSLSAALDQLHGEAVATIRASDIPGYRAVADAYYEALLAFPRAWARFGQPLVPELARSVRFFEMSDLDRIGRSLAEEIRLAVRSDSRDIALQAVDLPRAVATASIPLGATALIDRMAQLLEFAYFWSSERSAGDPLSNTVAETAWMKLMELGDRYAVPSLTANRDEAIEASAGAALMVLARSWARFCKELIDRKEAARLEETVKRWRRMLELWHPDAGAPDEWQVQLMTDQLGPDGPAVKVARERLEAARRRVDRKRQLDRENRLARFGLLMWVVFKASPESPDPAIIRMFNLLTQEFVGGAELVQVAADALSADSRDALQWAEWYSREQETGRMYSIPWPDQLFRTVALVLLNLASSGAAVALPPAEWLGINGDAFKRQVGDIAKNEAYRGFLVPKGLNQQAVDYVLATITAAAEQQRQTERDQLVASELDPDRSSSFGTAVMEAFPEYDFARFLFERVGRYSRQAPLGVAEASTVVREHRLPKELFVAGTHALSIGLEAGLVEDIHNVEIALMLTNLRHNSRLGIRPAGRAGMRGRLAQLIAQMVGQGYSQSALLLPFDIDLEHVLGVDRAWAIPEDKRLDMPSQIRYQHRGYIDDVPVFQTRVLPGDTAYVVDLARWGEWVQRTTPDDQSIVVTISPIHAQPEVTATLEVAFQLTVIDRDAARRIVVPPEA